MRPENAYLVTDVGLFRTNNEDTGLIRAATDSTGMEYTLALVADGVGGAPAGEVASQITVDTIARLFDPHARDNPEASLAWAIRQANRAVYERAEGDPFLHGMCTTITAAVVIGATAYFGQVGDSRAYLKRGKELRQITEDHSYVNELAKKGIIDREQARVHPNRNIITRVIGTSPTVQADIYRIDLQKNDILLLCSDGLSDMAPDDAILAVLAASDFSEAGDRLIKLAKDYGGNDNITVALFTYA